MEHSLDPNSSYVILLAGFCESDISECLDLAANKGTHDGDRERLALVAQVLWLTCPIIAGPFAARVR